MRACNSPAPVNGGTACVEPSTETCNTQACSSPTPPPSTPPPSTPDPCAFVTCSQPCHTGQCAGGACVLKTSGHTCSGNGVSAGKCSASGTCEAVNTPPVADQWFVKSWSRGWSGAQQGTLCNCEPVVGNWKPNPAFASQRVCVEAWHQQTSQSCVLDSGESFADFSLAAKNEGDGDSGNSSIIAVIAAIGGLLCGALGLFATQKVTRGGSAGHVPNSEEMGSSGRAGTTSRTKAPYMETADI